MAVITADSFLEILEKSELLSAAEFKQVRKATRDLNDAREIAKHLLREKLATRWQAAQLLAGRHGLSLGKYRLLEQLDANRSGRVFLAEHAQMGRRAAIKVLSRKHAASPEAFERFLSEARAVASFNDRNIVHVYDVDSEGQNYYLVMEYVEGRNLESIVDEEGFLPFPQIGEYIRQAAEGLSHAHDRGMIHRNIKPSNLLIDNRDTVKILGMGVGSLSITDSKADADTEPALADYLSPEQAAGEAKLDHRSDIYSLGCCLYFLLTGEPPFNKGSYAERLVRHQEKDPPSVSTQRTDAPPELIKLCRKMMAKKLTQRVQTAAEVATYLGRWLAANQPAAESAPSKPPRKPPVDEKKAPPPRKPAEKAAGKATEKAADDLFAIQAEPEPWQKGAAKKKSSGGGVAVKKKEKKEKKVKAQPTDGGSSMKLPLILGGVALVCLLLIGGSVAALGYWLLSSSGEPTEVAMAVDPETGEPIEEGPADPDAEPSPDVPADPASEGSNSEGSNSETPTDAAPADPAGTPTTVNKPPTTDPGAEDPTGADPKTEANPAPPATEPSTPEVANAPADPPAEPENVPDPNEEPVPPSAPRNGVRGVGGGPFGSLSDFVTLPEIPKGKDDPGDALKEYKLGDVLAPGTSVATAKLIGGENAVPARRGAFIIGRANNGLANRDFEIKYVPDANSTEGPVIAKLALKEDQLQFQWTEAALAESNSSYLRNCRFEIRMGTASKEIGLREPTKEAPIAITFDKSKVEAILNIPDAPAPEDLMFEVTSIVGDIPAQHYVPTNFIPASDGSMLIEIGEGNPRPLRLSLKTDMKRDKLNVTLSSVFKLSGMPMPQPMTAQTMTKLNEFIEAQIAGWTTTKGRVNASKLPPAQKKVDLQTIEQKLLEANTAKKEAAILDGIYSALAGGKGQIHFRVYYKAAEGVVELAKSDVPVALALKTTLTKAGAQVTTDNLDNITSITMTGGGVTNAMLDSLEGQTNLEFLDITGAGITDYGLASLESLPNLTLLRLDGTGVTSMGLDYIRTRPQLQELSLAKTEVDNLGILHLQHLPKLKNLNLDGSKIDRQGLVYLKKLKSLESVSLKNLGLTDPDLVPLYEMTWLKSINLAGNKVTTPGIKALKGAIKGVTVTVK